MRGWLCGAGLLLLAGCAPVSEVVELSPGVHGLSAGGRNLATAAQTGVERARAFCAARRGEFEVVRTEFGANEYRIAFRCPVPRPGGQRAEQQS